VNLFSLNGRAGMRAWRRITDTRHSHPAELAAQLERPLELRRRSDNTATPQRSSARFVEPRSVRHHLMNEDVFRTVLVRERKRADRSNQPFVVLLLSVESGEAARSAMWDGALDALSAAKRDTDVMGWFEEGATVALIVPDIDRDASAVARELEDRVRAEMAKRLSVEGAGRIAIDLHVHGADAEGLWPVEPLLERVVAPDPQMRLQAAAKRAFDVVASGLLLLLLSPVFLVVSVLVKLKSPGPVFFRQQRIGERARPFTMLKFRSMHVNNDSAIHQQYVTWFITASDQEKAAKGAVFKLTNDPRITPIGGFLRKSSLDELPQLWNVFRGDMSLVGPRPPLEYEVQKYAPWHRRRVLEAKPGITGLWQVTGRSRTTFDEMVRLDLRYARRVSVWTDIKILLATPRAVIMGKGAC
jgi:lipopolysaccharide/colanic/teichoic acid biosynthesis glycosyltransferase